MVHATVYATLYAVPQHAVLRGTHNVVAVVVGVEDVRQLPAPAHTHVQHISIAHAAQ